VKSGRSTNYLSRSDAISLLKKEGCNESVIRHSLTVSKNAKRIAEDIKANGYDIDVEFIEIASLLHDIGRCKTHGITHGIEGGKILKKISPKFARVCETHIGAGLDKKEAASLGLPARDYLPETLEEKVIAHADNLVQGEKIVGINEAIKELEEKLGRGHPAIKRVKELNDFIERLRKNAHKKRPL